MTVSLLSTIKTESRDRLYFDQWQYAFVFFVKEAHLLRCRDVDQMRKQATMRQSWAHLRDRYAGNTVSNLVAVLTYINGIAEPFKLIVSGNWATIYSNEPDLGDCLVQACGFVTKSRLKQAVIDRPRDTVLLLNPTHQFRSYFKSQHFPGAKIPALREFFAAQGNAIQPSSAMQRFLQGTWPGNHNHNHWLPDHYYVEYDNPVYATMLALIMPRPFRKTMTIVQRINT